MSLANLARRTDVAVVAAFLVILGAGLATGWLLLQYDQGLGFHRRARGQGRLNGGHGEAGRSDRPHLRHRRPE